jgi:hypothetical protein
LLGLAEVQLLGKTSFDPDWNVIHEDGSPFPGNTHPVPQAIATGLPVNDIVMGVYHPVNKNRVWLLVDAIPQLNADGNVHQVVCTFIDITQRKQAEADLQKKMDELLQFQRLTVGREHKMIELKKEVNELLRNSGKVEKYRIVENN